MFRPSAKVRSPDGRDWEIYAFRFRLPPSEGEPSRRIARLLRHLPRLARAALAAPRSRTWTIEAVAYLPAHEAYAWSTVDEFKGQVLAQVEGSLARGDVPQHLTNATYLGWRRSER
jgi:hypothetical protein